jgi:hypothetical protein
VQKRKEKSSRGEEILKTFVPPEWQTKLLLVC